MRIMAGGPKKACCDSCARRRGVGLASPCGEIPAGCVCTESGHVACYYDATDPSAGPFALGGDDATTSGSTLGAGVFQTPSTPSSGASLAPSTTNAPAPSSGVTITTEGCDRVARAAMIAGALAAGVGGAVVGGLVGYFAAR